MIKLGHEIKYTAHQQAKFATATELTARVESVIEGFNKKMDYKLDTSQYNDRMTELEVEIEKNSKKSAKYAGKIAEAAAQTKSKVEESNKEIMHMRDEIEGKLTREEGSRLWGNFSRFAVYDDLKELYQKCLPAISIFEDKLQDFETEQTKIQ